MRRLVPPPWVWLLLLLSCPCRTEAAKRALLVGVNRYDKESQNLQGCVNDVRGMQELLTTRFGFPAENIRVLLDDQATKKGILEAFQSWLIDPCRPGDIEVFHWSGHGDQARDQDGDEADGLDETICPFDVKLSNADYDVLDDELGALIERVPTDNLTVILDSCHSGTGTKGLLDLARPRSLGRGPRGARATTPVAAPAIPRGDGLGKPGHCVLISGCLPNETAQDCCFMEGTEKVWHGALTYSLLRALRESPRSLTYEELMQDVRTGVRAKSKQTPQLEGAFKGREVFGGYATGFRASPVVEVRDQERTVILKRTSGSEHAVGSTFRVYRPGTTDFSQDPLGEVVVTGLGPEETIAKVTKQSAKIVPGSQAVLASMAQQPLSRLYLRLLDYPPGESASLVRAMVKALPYVEPVDATKYADCALRREGAHKASIRYPDGSVIRSLEYTRLDNLLKTADEDLMRLYGIKHLAMLENPRPPFRVGISTADGGDTIAIGAPVRLRVWAERDCWLTVVDLGTSGKVNVLFPNKWNPGGDAKAGQDIEIPPAEARYRFRAQGPAGRELIKVIATLKPLDLTASQPASSAAPQEMADTIGFLSSLREKLAVGLSGSQTQLPVTEWSSATLILDVKEEK